MTRLHPENVTKTTHVLQIGTWQLLFSYETPVAASNGIASYRTEKYHSHTTSSHINKWLGEITAAKKPQEFFDGLLGVML